MTKQKKHLKPYQLFLIGLGLFLITIFIIPHDIFYGALANSLLYIVILILWIVSAVQAIKNRVGKNKNTSNSTSTESRNEPEAYAYTLSFLSAKVSDDLQKQIGFNDEQATEVMGLVVAFCLLMLMKRFSASGVASYKGRSTIELVTGDIFKHLSDGDTDDTHRDAFGSHIIGIVKKYGDLPLSKKDGSKGLGGTLMWEYSKLMLQTMGKDPRTEIEGMMFVTSRLSNANKALEENTTKLVKSLL